MNAVYYYYIHTTCNCIGGGEASFFQYLTQRGDLLLLESVAWGSFSGAFYQRFCLSASMVLVFGSGRCQASYLKILEVTLISEMPFLISELLLPKTERNLNSLLQLANTNSSCSNSTLRQWESRLICQRTAWFSLQVLKSLLSACKAMGAGVMQSIWRWDVRHRSAPSAGPYIWQINKMLRLLSQYEIWLQPARAAFSFRSSFAKPSSHFAALSNFTAFENEAPTFLKPVVGFPSISPSHMHQQVRTLAKKAKNKVNIQDTIWFCQWSG